MTWDDFFEFDQAAYRTKIFQMDEANLRREHTIVRQKCLSACASATLGVGGALHTGGVSLVFTGIGLRRNSYNDQKREIIESRMDKEGWEITDLRKRDIAMAIGPTIIAAGVAPGIEGVSTHFAGHAATEFASQHMAETASMAIHHTTPLLHFMEEGVKTQMHAVGEGLAGHAPQLVPIEAIASNTPEFFGFAAGQATAQAVEIKGTSKLIKLAAGVALDKQINPKIE